MTTYEDFGNEMTRREHARYNSNVYTNLQRGTLNCRIKITAVSRAPWKLLLFLQIDGANKACGWFLIANLRIDYLFNFVGLSLLHLIQYSSKIFDTFIL